MKKKTYVLFACVVFAVFAILFSAFPVMAAAADDAEQTETESVENNDGDVRSSKAMAAGIAVGAACAAGAIGMAIATAKSAESMARQPEASGKINSAMMLGFVFIETAVLYALIIAILIIFVL